LVANHYTIFADSTSADHSIEVTTCCLLLITTHTRVCEPYREHLDTTLKGS